MNFEKWMHSTGLSNSSVLKYCGAIEGVLSTWAADGGLIEESILEITSKARFDALVINIHKLPIFQERNKTGHKMYSSALNKYSEFLALGAIQSIEEDIEDILAENTKNSTKILQLISARVGQGKFRKSLLNYWGKCAVTGVENPSMLVASHIKPWSKSTNSERLNCFNGLLLTPNLDQAFDQGLISFSPEGEIIISTLLEDKKELGINQTMHVELSIKHQQFMEFHRSQVFKNS